MSIPSFKKITINSAATDILVAQLDQINFRSGPHILSLHAVLESQEACLKIISDYFEKYPQKLLPYPPYVLTTLTQYEGPLVLIKSEDQMPKFFKVKDRPLNHKETNLLKQIKLLQKKFSHINFFESQKVLDSYSSQHKDIGKVQSEIDFYQKLSQKLDQQNEP